MLVCDNLEGSRALCGETLTLAGRSWGIDVHVLLLSIGVYLARVAGVALSGGGVSWAGVGIGLDGTVTLGRRGALQTTRALAG